MPLVSIMSNENRHPDETQLRSWLENALGELAETSWAILLESGEIREFLEGRMDWNNLREYAESIIKNQRRYERELRKKWRLSPETEEDNSEDSSSHTNPKASGQAFSVELPEREKKRAAVLLEIQVRRAAEHPAVVVFRDERLGGRLLSAEEAEEQFFTPGVPHTTDESLAALGRRLQKYYGWHPGDACWWTLTGESPAVRPLEVSFFDSVSDHGPSYGKITLHVAPWVPAEEVKKAVIGARDKMRSDEGPGTVGEKRLEVLRFVEEECAKRGYWPGSEVLLQVWNRKYPRWSYPKYRPFLKAYRETRKEVLYPVYHAPSRAKTPNIERQESRIGKWFEEIRKGPGVLSRPE